MAWLLRHLIREGKHLGRYQAILSLWERGRIRDAIEGLEALLEVSDLPNDLREDLTRRRQAWQQALDEKWSPPQRQEPSSYAPVFERARIAMAGGEQDLALRFGWQYLQYCPVGTVAFSLALATTTNAAAIGGQWRLARACARMFLAHYELMAAAAFRENTPVGSEVPCQRDHSVLDDIRCSIPVAAGILGMNGDLNEHVWPETLELALREGRAVKLDELCTAASVLVKYYEQVGDEQRIGWARQLAANLLGGTPGGPETA